VRASTAVTTLKTIEVGTLFPMDKQSIRDEMRELLVSSFSAEGKQG
jgi:hypothetical protein